MSPAQQNSDRQTHACLISGQPIPNLLPLLHERPQKAIFIVTPQMRDQAVRLEKVVRKYDIQVSIVNIETAYDYYTMVSACEKLLHNATENELVLNVTGGTKIVALAAFQAFFFSDTVSRIIYCDTEHDRLLELAPDTNESQLANDLVKVYDYLACYGLPRSSGGRPPAGIAKRRSHLPALVDLFTHNEKLLSKLNSAIESANPNRQYANIPLNALGENGEKLVLLLEKSAVGQRTADTNFNISSQEFLFFCKGGWLEEYVYSKVRSLSLQGLDLTMNVKVKWDGVGKKQTENEFDVLFTYRNRLHFISCKASNPDRVTSSGTRATEALNELDSLADRAGGLFGKAMLVSSRRLSDFDRSRAEKMNIHLVDGLEVPRLQHHLKTWLHIP